MTWDPATMLGPDLLHPNDAGMSYLADVMESALVGAGITTLSGKHVASYGDSWTAADLENTPGQRAIQQLVTSMSADSPLYNWAVSGYRAGDIAVMAINGSGLWPAGLEDFVAVLAGAGLNNLTLADTTPQRAAIANHLRAWFAVVCAAERIEQTAFTFTSGTWTHNTDPDFSDGSNRFTTDEGATATYTITEPGTYYLLTHGADGSSLVGGKMTVSQGATVLGEFDSNQQTVNTGTVLTGGHGPAAMRLEGVEAGTLTVTVNLLGRSGALGFFDALLRIREDRPPILAVKPVEVLVSSHDNPTLLAYIRDLYDTLADEFGPTVIVADPAAPSATAGTLSGTVPALTGSLTGTVVTPPPGPLTGTLSGTVPALSGGLSGTVVDPPGTIPAAVTSRTIIGSDGQTVERFWRPKRPEATHHLECRVGLSGTSSVTAQGNPRIGPLRDVVITHLWLTTAEIEATGHRPREIAGCLSGPSVSIPWASSAYLTGQGG